MKEKMKVQEPPKRIKHMVREVEGTTSKVLELSEKEEAYFREIIDIEEESKRSNYSVGGLVTF